MFRRLVWFLALISVIFLVLRPALNYAVGALLRYGFARGTGCVVELHSPRINYFPLTGSIRDVVIYHPAEGRDKGFKAQRIRVKLELGALLGKRVLLSELALEGATAYSIGGDTGFIQTMMFLFADSGGEHSTGSAWHSALTSGWRVRVPRVTIETPSLPGTHFVIGAGDFAAKFTQVSFLSIDPKDDPAVPVEISARGTDLRLALGDAEERSFGNVELAVKIGSGVVAIDKAVIGYEAPGTPDRSSRGIFGGYLKTRGDGEYNITYDVSLFDRLLGRVVDPQHGAWDSLRAVLTTAGRVSGSFFHPQFDGFMKMQAEQGMPAVQRAACSVQEVSAEYAADVEQIRLRKLTVEDFVREGTATLTFAGRPAVEGDMLLELQNSSDFAARCLGSGNVENNPESALARSPEEVDLLSLRFNYANDEMAASLGSADAGNNVRAAPAGQQKAVSIEMRYNFARRELHEAAIRLHDYPVFNIVRLLAPFASERVLVYASRVLSNNSRVSFDGQAKISGESAAASTARGSFKLNGLRIGNEEVNLSSAVFLSGTDVMLKDLALDSKAGMLNGELAYAFGGKLSAKAAFSGLQIAEILGLDTYFPEAALEAKGKAEVEYEKPALRYHGQTALKLSRRGLPQSVLSAGLSIEGNEELLKAVLDTADRTLAAELRYPLRGEPAAALELSANAKDFSFAGLLAAVSGSGNNARTDIPEARLSAALVYTAKRDQLLSGRGSLRVAEVVYALPGDLTVRQARPMNLEMAQGRLIFTDCALLVQDKELRLSGFLDAEQGWRARIAGSMSLSPKLLRVRAIEQLSGLVDLNVDLSGPATAPAAAGTVTLSRGALSLGAGEGHILLEQLEGQASLDGSSLRLDFLSAKSGAGGINASGSIQNLSSREKRSAEAQVSMDRILVDPLENMSITFGGAVNLRQTPGAPMAVGGDLIIQELIYEDVVKLTEVLGALSRRILGGAPGKVKEAGEVIPREAAKALEFSLRLHADRALIVDTNVVQAELRTDLMLTGSLAEPRLDGNIAVIQGQFGLEANRFEIITGELIFSGHSLRLDPRLNIVGETTVRSSARADTHVRMLIGGTLTKPKISFSSDAGLSENEIISSLGVSADLTSLQPFGSRTEMRSFRELISPASDLSLRDRLSWVTNFSEVQIESARSERTNEFVPRLVAQRPLVNNFSLKIESELSGEQASKIYLDYPLTPYLSLTSGWRSSPVTKAEDESSGVYGAGVVYRKTFPGPLIWSGAPLKEEGGGGK